MASLSKKSNNNNNNSAATKQNGAFGNSSSEILCDTGPNLLTTGTITVTTSASSTQQRLRSHTTSDVCNTISEPLNSLTRPTPASSYSGGSSSANHHLWNVDLSDLSYLTHMQRVRARASFARQMSNSSDRNRRRESIASVNFPGHLTGSGSGLNMLVSSKQINCLFKFIHI